MAEPVITSQMVSNTQYRLRAGVLIGRGTVRDCNTNGIDDAEDILRQLKLLNRGGITVIMVTHEPEIAAHAKRVIRIKDGLVVSDELNEEEGPGRRVPLRGRLRFHRRRLVKELKRPIRAAARWAGLRR